VRRSVPYLLFPCIAYHLIYYIGYGGAKIQ
jgi:hypothetical protein